MSKVVRFLNYIADSFNEIIDLFLHSILFGYVIAYAFGGTNDFAYAFFIVVPAFILLAPLFKRLHKRHLIEWIIKTPAYIFVGFMVFILAYGIVATGIDIQQRPGPTALIIIVLIQSYWVFHTLRRLAKPPLSLEERHQKRSKRLLVSAVLALGSTVLAISSLSYIVSQPDLVQPGAELAVFVSQVISGLVGFVSAVFALMMYTYFFLSLLDRT